MVDAKKTTQSFCGTHLSHMSNVVSQSGWKIGRLCSVLCDFWTTFVGVLSKILFWPPGGTKTASCEKPGLPCAHISVVLISAVNCDTVRDSTFIHFRLAAIWFCTPPLLSSPLPSLWPLKNWPQARHNHRLGLPQTTTRVCIAPKSKGS